MLSFEEVKKDLEKISLSESPDIVAHVGEKSERLGRVFAERFQSDMVCLPSLNVKGYTPRLKKFTNRALRCLPEAVLRELSIKYKKWIQKTNLVLPEDFDMGCVRGDKTLLLVDDSTFTGNTMEFWKRKIKDSSDGEVYTFSITVNGDYRPDYFCTDEWQPFDWRPVGI
jgi:hypothetical protein